MRRKQKINDEELNIRYSNWISMLIDLIKPKNLYFIGGRGTAKTTDILVKRLIDVVYDMPGSTIFFVSDTYVNATTNIIPELIEGLKRQNFIYGVHYVIDEEPPAHFKKPNRHLFEYKHTMIFCTGVVALVKSLDRQSMTAGISGVHMFGDEVKFFDDKKINKSIPTLRGDSIAFGNSPFFMGQTYFTDMPDTSQNQYDWILKKEENMDLKQIYTIFQTALHINELQWQIFKYKDNPIEFNEKKYQRMLDNLDKWMKRFRKIRTNSTMFVLVSSLVNVDILTFEYILNQQETLAGGFEEFKTAILSFKPSLAVGKKFYAKLAERHFYTDGYNYDYYMPLGLSGADKYTCQGLRYLQTNKPLECGVDFGNMCSMVIAQESKDCYRILKNIFTLSPEWIDQLGLKFRNFFNDQKHKHLIMYYDRAANNYSKTGKDYASQLKKAIETDSNGKRTGWLVTLSSIGQGNIEQGLEYSFADVLLSESNPGLPKILIDQNECRELKSSLELAPIKIGIDAKGRRKVIKDKTSEKKDIKRLALESTNMSDAFKYLVCRPKWITIYKRKF